MLITLLYVYIFWAIFVLYIYYKFANCLAVHTYVTGYGAGSGGQHSSSSPGKDPLTNTTYKATKIVRPSEAPQGNRQGNIIKRARKYAKPEFPIIAGFRLVQFIYPIWYIGLDL